MKNNGLRIKICLFNKIAKVRYMIKDTLFKSPQEIFEDQDNIFNGLIGRLKETTQADLKEMQKAFTSEFKNNKNEALQIALQYQRFVRELKAILNRTARQSTVDSNIHHYFNQQAYFEIHLDKKAENFKHNLQMLALLGILGSTVLAVTAVASVVFIWPAAVAFGAAAVVMFAVSLGLAAYGTMSNDHTMKTMEETAFRGLFADTSPSTAPQLG